MKNQTSNPIVIQPNDTKFPDSRDPGDPRCICSRCGQVIEEGDAPVRAWPEDGRYEYRYHISCLGFDSFRQDLGKRGMS